MSDLGTLCMNAGAGAAGPDVDPDSKGTQVPRPPLGFFPFLESKQKNSLANWDTVSAWASGGLRFGGSCSASWMPGVPVASTCWPGGKSYLGTAPPAGRGGSALTQIVARQRQSSGSDHPVCLSTEYRNDS